MAFSLPNAPYKSDWAQPYPDFGEALNKGIKRGFEPRAQAEELLQSMLKSKNEGIKSKYAEDLAKANLSHIDAQIQGLNDTHGMAGLNKQLLQQKVNDALYEQELNKKILSGGNQPANNANIMGLEGLQNRPSESVLPSIEQQSKPDIELPSNQNIQAKGNPSLYHIDDMIDSDPRAAAYLKKKGYEKKVTPKYDPKTGTTSVITQYPSGKIVVEANKSASTGFVPLTEKTKSTQQNIVTGIDSAVPALKKILDLDIPKQGAWNIFSPQNQATYSALSGGAIDSLVAGLGLPKIQSSTDLVKDMVHRKANESESHYKDRIRDLLTDLSLRKNRAIQTLQQGLSLKEDVPVEETKVINGKTYHKINGEWHE